MSKWQGWFCKRCGCSGKVVVREGEGVWAIVSRISQAHAASEPGCTQEMRGISLGQLEKRKDAPPRIGDKG